MTSSDHPSPLDLARDPSRSAEARFDAAMEAYDRATTHGDLREVLSALLSLEAGAASWPPAQAVQLTIAIASIEDEMGLGDEARARLEASRDLAEQADAQQRCRLAYYLAISYAREGLVDDARGALEYFGRQIGPHTPDRTTLNFTFLTGVVEEKDARWPEAERAYRRCVQMAGADHPEQASTARSGLARVMMTRGRFDEAAILIEDDAHSADDYHGAYIAGLLAFAHLGRLGVEEARRQADACLEAATAFDLSDLAANSFVARALAAWHEGEVADARAALRRSVALDVSPTNRESCLILDALFTDSLLPEAAQPEARALRRFLREEAPPREPLHAVIAALLAARRGAYRLSADGHTFTTPGGRHDLRQRLPMRRILTRLVQAQTADEGSLPTGDLFDAGWPDTSHVGPNGFRRVYTELHRLRELGLEIVSIDGGYQLLTEVTVEGR